MRPLERYTETFSIEISQPKDRIILALKNLAANPKRNVLSDRLFYGEAYKLTDDSFEIIKRKSFFDAYGASGKIAMKFLPSDNFNKTRIVFQTNPYRRNDDAIRFLILLFFLIVWTIASLLISVNFNTILIVILGWIILPSIIHVWLQWNKIKLRDYANSFVKKYFQ